MVVEVGDTAGRDDERQEAIPFIDTGVERGGNRPNFQKLVRELQHEPASAQPKVVVVTELSRLIGSASEKQTIDELLDAKRLQVMTGREAIFTAQGDGRERYEQASRLLALAYDGAFAPQSGSRTELVDIYVREALGRWLALHGTPENEAIAALADVRARLSSLGRIWGSSAAHALLGAYRELADRHEPAELPTWTRDLALVGVRNSELETLHLAGYVEQHDWRVLTQAAAYVFNTFDDLPQGHLDEDDRFAGIVEASPATAAAFSTLYELGLGKEATWDTSLLQKGRRFELEVVTVPVTSEGFDVMHAMDPRVPKRFVSTFFENDEPPEVLALPSFKHISRNPMKLFPIIEEALRRGMTVATNNCCLKAGHVCRRAECVQYNSLDVSWCVDLPRSVILDTLTKPGRNDACPCGSVKKYKHCCGR